MNFFRALILIMTLSAVSCKGGEKSTNSTRKVKCTEAILANSDFESCTFPGKVVAATDVNLGFRVAGIIDQICATDGTFVRKGSVVARLDSRDYALQLSATQAEFDAIKAEVDRVVALYADQSVSANDYDKATNGLRAITAKLEAHKNALSDTELRAPFDGYIQKSNFDKGEAVAAGTPVISIISSSAPEITIDIPAEYYLKQAKFESAIATMDLFGDTKFKLSLKGVSPKANLNQLYKMTFRVENSGGVVPSAGMSAMVEMRYTSDQDSNIIIPFSAVVERDGQSSVWVVTNGKVASRKIEVREIQSNGMVAVRGDITAAEMVVVAGVNSLKERLEVEILEKVSASNIGGLK
ncbi:MAG: efflux RND transporter periplasmic adaptor subunit [Rikenellaceae bacterium]